MHLQLGEEVMSILMKINNENTENLKGKKSLESTEMHSRDHYRALESIPTKIPEKKQKCMCNISP